MQQCRYQSPTRKAAIFNRERVAHGELYCALRASVKQRALLSETGMGRKNPELCRTPKPSVELALHADVDGSLEALTESLLALNTGSVVFKVVKASVGAPSSADVQFAQTTGAALVAFGVKVPAAVSKQAQTKQVPVVESKCALTEVLSAALRARCLRLRQALDPCGSAGRTATRVVHAQAYSLHCTPICTSDKSAACVHASSCAVRAASSTSCWTTCRCGSWRRRQS